MCGAGLRAFRTPNIPELSSYVNENVRELAELRISECRCHDTALTLVLFICKHGCEPR